MRLQSQEYRRRGIAVYDIHGGFFTGGKSTEISLPSSITFWTDTRFYGLM